MHPEVEEEAEIKEIEGGLDPRIEISINMDLSVLGFYGYIGNIGEISISPNFSTSGLRDSLVGWDNCQL